MRRHPVLGYALSSLVSAWAFVVATPLLVLGVMEFWGIWAGDVQGALDELGAATGLVGALLCGAVAVDTARLHQPGCRHLLQLGRTQARSFGFVWAAGFVSAALPYLATCAVLVATTMPTPPVWQDLGHGLAIIVVGVATLGACAAVGSLIGRYLSPLLAGVTATILGIAAFYLSLTGGGSAVTPLSFGGGTIPRVGTLFSLPRATLQVAICAVIIAVAMMATVRFTDGSVRPTARGVAAIGLVGALVCAPPVLIHIPSYTPTASLEWSCTDSAPPVCAPVQYINRLSWYHQVSYPLMDAARAHGYDSLIPDVIVLSIPERPGAAPFPTGTVAYAPFYDRSTEMNQWALSVFAADLVRPLSCPAYLQSDAVRNEWFPTITRIGRTWVSLLMESRDDIDAIMQGEEPLTAAEVQDIMQRFARCDFDVP